MQDYYIRHVNGCTVDEEAEQHLKESLEDAINRRTSEVSLIGIIMIFFLINRMCANGSVCMMVSSISSHWRILKPFDVGVSGCQTRTLFPRSSWTAFGHNPDV